MSSPATELVSSPPAQLTLELPAPPATAETPLVPVRMVNEYVYCPRLAFLEWVDSEWANSGDTEEGRRAHVRVDSGGGRLPAPSEIDDRPDFVARSVMLASETLGIIAKMDLVEGEDGTVTPIDTKKGRRPHVAEGAYEPERVQVCAQALILEDAGYKVADGAIWYAGSRERVRIALDEELRAKTRSAISEPAAHRRCRPPAAAADRQPEMHEVLARRHLPARRGDLLPPRAGAASAQPGRPHRAAALRAGAGRAREQVGRGAGDRDRRQEDRGGDRRRLRAGAARRGVAHHAGARRAAERGNSGHLRIDRRMGVGHTVSTGHRNIAIRIAQYASRVRRAALARIRPRPGGGEDPQLPGLPAAQLQGRRRSGPRRHSRSAHAPSRPCAVRAVAGRAARFRGRGGGALFPRVPDHAGRGGARLPEFSFDKRTRRPPADPVNAMLSLSYACSPAPGSACSRPSASIPISVSITAPVIAAFNVLRMTAPRSACSEEAAPLTLISWCRLSRGAA